jgi:hypothetical protein
MVDRSGFQVHANVNVIGRDASLRLTITTYSDNGDLEATRTWRRRATAADFDGLTWMAAWATVELGKMMNDELRTRLVQVDDLDQPLF